MKGKIKMKLKIKINITELTELESIIEQIKRLNLQNSPELNPEIIIELGE
jgi:hypothetical protein